MYQRILAASRLQLDQQTVMDDVEQRKLESKIVSMVFLLLGPSAIDPAYLLAFMDKKATTKKVCCCITKRYRILI